MTKFQEGDYVNLIKPSPADRDFYGDKMDEFPAQVKSIASRHPIQEIWDTGLTVYKLSNGLMFHEYELEAADEI